MPSLTDNDLTNLAISTLSSTDILATSSTITNDGYIISTGSTNNIGNYTISTGWSPTYQPKDKEIVVDLENNTCKIFNSKKNTFEEYEIDGIKTIKTKTGEKRFKFELSKKQTIKELKKQQKELNSKRKVIIEKVSKNKKKLFDFYNTISLSFGNITYGSGTITMPFGTGITTYSNNIFTSTGNFV